MRVLLTGAGNLWGRAIAEALLADGHLVRLFGVDEESVADLVKDDICHLYAGDVKLAGSLEPALAERDALVHAACMDAAGKVARKARSEMAVRVDRGTLYTRYAAERELVDHFIHIAPQESGKDPFREVQAAAVAHVEGTRGAINKKVIRAGDPREVAKQVAAALKSFEPLGKSPTQAFGVTP